MRIASVAVGIADYEDSALRSSDTLLRYSVSDAKAFFDYSRTAWPESKTGSRHVLLSDREATLVGLMAVLSDIRQGGPFDLLLLYLSGHGQLHGEAGSFCLADARYGIPSFDAPAIDTQLSTIAATRVFMILDCCHAGAVVADASFFSKLHQAEARLYCASARSEERAWEDSKLKRSVLSHVLMSLLSTESSVANQAGILDVESHLLPALRQQVPLMAALMKGGAIQQPVTGGVGSAPIVLPTVAGSGFGRAPNLAEILRNNARRILLGVIVLVVVTLLLADQLLYHFSVSATGDILVRPGVPVTYSALPIRLAPSVDTGFSISQLEAHRESEIRAIAEGRIWGMSTHLGSSGMRTWIEPLAELLSKKDSLEFIRGPDVLAETELNPEDLPVTRGKINLLARLRGETPEVFVHNRYGKRAFPTPSVACSPLITSTQVFDFDTPSTPSISEGIRAQIRYFSRREPDAASSVWKLAKFVSVRAQLRSYDAVAMDEMRTFLVELARSWKELPLSADVTKQLNPYLSSSEPDSCAPLALGMLAMLGSPEQRSDAQKFFTHPAEPLASLLVGLRKNGLNYVEMPKLLLSLISTGPGLTEDSIAAFSGEFFSEIDERCELIAESQKLPDALYAKLFVQLGDSSDGFKQQVAFRYLSRAYKWLSPNQTTELRDWAAAHTDGDQHLSVFIVSLGLLGRATPLTPNQVRAIVGRLSPNAQFDSEEDPSFQGSVIEANADPAVVATAMAAQLAELPENSLDLVITVLGRRSNLEYADEATDSLAKRMMPDASSVAAKIIKRLGSERGSASTRRQTARFAIRALNRMPDQMRNAQIKLLANQWHQETEPEIRASIAQILATAN